MDILQVTAVLMTLTALFSYLNHLYLKLPATIGVMVIALCISLFILLLSWFGYPVLLEHEQHFLSGIDFSTTLLPAGEVRDILLPMTYAVVVFAMLVQGLTLGRLVKKLVPVE